MVQITFIDSEGTARTVDGEVGSTVMETAIKHGVPGIEAECGGACACSTCHVYIEEEWREKVGEPSPMEEDMLDFAFDGARRAFVVDVGDFDHGRTLTRKAGLAQRREPLQESPAGGGASSIGSCRTAPVQAERTDQRPSAAWLK